MVDCLPTNKEWTFLKDFDSKFKRLHKVWGEIDKRLEGATFGDTEKFLNLKRQEMTTTFKEIDPQVTIIVKQFEETMSKDTTLSQMVQSLKTQLEEESKKKEEVTKLNETLQQALIGNQKGDFEEAHVSIEFSTIFDLGTKGEGWKVNVGNPEKIANLMKKKIMSVGVLGAYDAGKTHLCNSLGNKKLRSGHQHRTNGIEIIYPEEDDVYYGLIDVPGSQEAHPISDKQLIAKLPLSENQSINSSQLSAGSTPGKVEGSKEDEGSNNTYLERYNLLHSDAKLTHSLKEKFIVENVDMVVIVTNKLSESDQEMIYKNLNYYKQWHETKKKGVAVHKYLYIVHNFKMLGKVEDVERQIEKDIKMCFEVEETPIFSTEKVEGCNNVMYRDQFGVCHLILATENSAAGNYYNKTTIGFLKSRIRNTESKNNLNLVESFQKFCNSHLHKMLGQPIELILDEKKSAFVNSKKTDIKIDGIAWTSLGEVVTSDFKPKHSILINQSEKGDLELIVDVESIDCERQQKEVNTGKSYMKAIIDNKDGYHCLKLKGQKRLDKGVTDEEDQKKKNSEFTNYSRGEGNFDMTINLVRNKYLKSKKVIDNYAPGITRFIFCFLDQNNDDDF
jgi:hypothetical protein